MTLKRVHIKTAMILGFSTLTILAFQNCSQVDFAESEASVFKAATTSDDSLRDPGVDPIADPMADPVVADNDDPEAPPSTGQPPKGKNPELPNEPKDKDDRTDDDEDSSDSLVECELISPNQKIILDQLLKKGSNASATRVCMSENACLQLINSYAAKRDCSLSLGASSLQDSEAQCTKIFPGSKGTCHNASVVSDEKVAEVLDLMGKSN